MKNRNCIMNFLGSKPRIYGTRYFHKIYSYLSLENKYKIFDKNYE